MCGNVVRLDLNTEFESILTKYAGFESVAKWIVVMPEGGIVLTVKSKIACIVKVIFQHANSVFVKEAETAILTSTLYGLPLKLV